MGASICKTYQGLCKDDESSSFVGLTTLQKDISNKSELRHTPVRLQTPQDKHVLKGFKYLLSNNNQGGCLESFKGLGWN